MNVCHLCGRPLPHHDDECRAHQDLALFQRVYHRLRAEQRNHTLQSKLMHLLAQHGRAVEDAA